jgi:hypothetical protein
MTQKNKNREEHDNVGRPTLSELGMVLRRALIS